MPVSPGRASMCERGSRPSPPRRRVCHAASAPIAALRLPTSPSAGRARFTFCSPPWITPTHFRPQVHVNVAEKIPLDFIGRRVASKRRVRRRVRHGQARADALYGDGPMAMGRVGGDGPRGLRRCFSLDPGIAAGRMRGGPVVQWSEPSAHNGVVAGSNPAGPTTKSLF